MVGHVMFADPFDAGLARVVKRCGHSLEGEGVVLHDEGTLICMGESGDAECGGEVVGLTFDHRGPAV